MNESSAQRKTEYVIDGAAFSTLSEAATEFTAALGLLSPWHGNLDAFNDILHGGFGTPDEGSTLIWRHSAISRQRLGYGETIKWLEERIQHCHPDNIPHFQHRLEEARRGEGMTLFDTLVEIIRDHADIQLRLE